MRWCALLWNPACLIVQNARVPKSPKPFPEPEALLANHKEDTQVNGAMYSPRNGGVEFVGSDPWAVRLKTHGINRIRIHE